MNTVSRAVLSAAIAIAALPAAASAASHDYAPGESAWSGSQSSEGLCVPALLCPVITNASESGVGAPGTEAGYISTRISSLAGVGATSIGTWESQPFVYNGVDGKGATEVRFGMARRGDVGQLLAVTGNTATYTVSIVPASTGAEGVTIIDRAPVAGAPEWSRIAPVEIAAGQLKRGDPYRIRISTRYDTGATVIPGGSADYDGVYVHARRQTGHGNGNGGGADTESGLAKSGVAGAAALDGKRIRVKVRCSSKLEGACKIGLGGLVSRHGPKLTARRHVRVASGKTTVVSLKVKNRHRGKLAGKKRIFVRQTVRADRMTLTSVKRLRLRH